MVKKTAFVLVVICLTFLQTAHASIGGVALVTQGVPAVIYENRDSIGPATLDLSISVNFCSNTVTANWTDAAGATQSLLVVGCQTLGVRTTLPPAGGTAPSAISVTHTAGPSPAQITWTVERVN